MKITPEGQAAIEKGRRLFNILLIVLAALPLALEVLLLIVPHYSGGILQMTAMYPSGSILLTALATVLGFLVGRGFNLRYIWLMANMIQIIYLAFFCFQLFHYSLGLGYLSIAFCITVLGGGFWSFYQPDIQLYLRWRQSQK